MPEVRCDSGTVGCGIHTPVMATGYTGGRVSALVAFLLFTRQEVEWVWPQSERAG